MMNPIEAYYSRAQDVQTEASKARCTQKYLEKSNNISGYGAVVYSDEHRDVYLQDRHDEHARQQEALKALRR